MENLIFEDNICEITYKSFMAKQIVISGWVISSLYVIALIYLFVILAKISKDNFSKEKIHV